MAMYDLPANVDYILEVTGREQLAWVGHSQGTAQWFIANIMYPDIHKKFKAFVAIASVAHVEHNTSMALMALAKLNLLNVLGDYFYSFASFPLWFDQLATNIPRFFPESSYIFIESGFGFSDSYHLQRDRLPLVFKNSLGGTSIKNAQHWYSNTQSGFQQFDYGHHGNFKIYG